MDDELPAEALFRDLDPASAITPELFAGFLRNVRHRAGRTLKELMEHADRREGYLSPATQSSIFNGHHLPTAEQLALILGGCGFTAEMTLPWIAALARLRGGQPQSRDRGQLAPDTHHDQPGPGAGRARVRDRAHPERHTDRQLPRGLGASRPQVAPLMMAPKYSRTFVARPELTEQIIAELCSEAGQTVSMTALRGAGGFGKTMLAAEVCRNASVQERFPGGVLWVGLDESAGEPMVATQIDHLCSLLGSESGAGYDLARARALFEKALNDAEPTLLVVDDAWSATQLRPFMITVPESSRLVTTRNSFALTYTTDSFAQVEVGKMRRRESRELLASGLDVTADADLDPLLDLIADWPLLLALTNGAIQAEKPKGDPLRTLRVIEQRLRARGPEAVSAPHAESRSDSISVTMEVSLRFLAEHNPAYLDRFLELGIFAAGPIPLSRLVPLWRETGGMSEFEVDDLCGELVSRSLVTWIDHDRGQIRLHDMVGDYLRHRLPPRREQELRQAYYAINLQMMAAEDLEDDEE